ncbi:MAG: transcription termination factor Rho, partial [Mycobacteriaceae bacterium]
EMGIGDTAGMRKGDLIVAIKGRQSNAGGAPASTPTHSATSPRAPRKRTTVDAQPDSLPMSPATADVESAATSEATEASNDSRRSRARRSSARAAGTPSAEVTQAAVGPETDQAPTASVSATAPSTEANEQPEKGGRSEASGQQREQNGRAPREQNDRQQGGRGNRQNSGTQNSGTQNSGNPGGQAGGGPSGGHGSQNQRQDRNDEDNDGRGRRGRRFRERRRGRDRGADQGAPNDRDIEVREDDVLQPVAGILDVLDNYAFVRTSGYLAGPNDVYVSMSLVRKNGLRRGDAITGAVRIAREGEQSGSRAKFNPLVRIDTINGGDAEAARKRPEFNKLTPLYPNQRLRLETTPQAMTARIIDLVMPIGKGQRALIVSPPKAGKTSVLQAIANAISVNNPECHLMVVLVDERPEEVTDMQRSVKGEVIASTFDRPPGDHTAVAEWAIERAKRLVESGTDVVVLLDSITRLGRAYNNSSPASGRILSGGVDSTALYPPKRFLGAARNIEFGGSLTIIATAMVETGSTGDTVIFEEFKGTGNAELKLDRKIAERRVFPAVDVNPSGTRKDELLMAPDEYKVALKLRRVLSGLDSHQAIDLLTGKLRKSGSNAEFLMEVARTAPGATEEHPRET